MKGFLNRLYSMYALTVFILLAICVLLAYVSISWLPEKKRLLGIYKINWVWQKSWCLLTGVRVQVVDPHKRDPKATYIFVVNHSNMLDILVAGGSIVHPFRPLAKKELLNIPILGWVFRFMFLPVDRKSVQSRSRSFQRMVEKLKEGISILIFPEGTRNRTPEPLKSFYDGAFRLSVETGVPILPVVILNVRNLQPVNTFRLYPGKIQLKYLDPVFPSTQDSDSFPRMKEKIFTSMYTELEKSNSL